MKRGPTGVIASTMDDAFTTADIIARDWEESVKFIPGDVGEKVGWEAVKKMVEERGIRAVSWRDWERIDAEEQRRGREKGKVREKFTSVDAMLKVLAS